MKRLSHPLVYSLPPRLSSAVTPARRTHPPVAPTTQPRHRRRPRRPCARVPIRRSSPLGQRPRVVRIRRYRRPTRGSRSSKRPPRRRWRLRARSVAGCCRSVWGPCSWLGPRGGNCARTRAVNRSARAPSCRACTPPASQRRRQVRASRSASIGAARATVQRRQRALGTTPLSLSSTWRMATSRVFVVEKDGFQPYVLRQGPAQGAVRVLAALPRLEPPPATSAVPPVASATSAPKRSRQGRREGPPSQRPSPAVAKPPGDIPSSAERFDASPRLDLAAAGCRVAAERSGPGRRFGGRSDRSFASAPKPFSAATTKAAREIPRNRTGSCPTAT